MSFRNAVLIFVVSLLVNCGSVRKMSLDLQNSTNERPMDIAKKVLLENGYTIINKTDEILETEFKMDNWTFGQYRWKVIINVIDKSNFVANIHTELKLASESTWTITETLRDDVAAKIIDPLEASFKKYGVTIKPTLAERR